jgi:hypothetical protein
MNAKVSEHKWKYNLKILGSLSSPDKTKTFQICYSGTFNWKNDILDFVQFSEKSVIWFVINDLNLKGR